MNKYRIVHIPSGLYVKPITSGSWGNLTSDIKKAKVYDKERSFSQVIGNLYAKGRDISEPWARGLLIEETCKYTFVNSKDEFKKVYINEIEEPHFYIGRDKSGSLYCFTDLPVKDEESGTFLCDFCSYLVMKDSDKFKDITWEKGPQVMLFGDVIE